MFSPQLLEKCFDLLDEGVIVLDEELRLVYLNSAAAKMLDVSEAAHLQETTLPAELKPHAVQRVIDYSGKKLQLRWQEAAEQGGGKFHLGIVKDLTKAEDDKKMISCMYTMLDSINEGIIASDTEGRIFIFNKASEKLEGLSQAEVLGRKIVDVYHKSYKNSEHHTVLQSKKPLLDVYERFITKGKEINLVSDNFPLYYKEEVLGVYSVCRNVTKIKELLDNTIKLQQEINASGSANVKKGPVRYSFEDIIGDSSLLQLAKEEARKAAESDSPVLVFGDTGTGKELFVQSIHQRSARRREPFVPINCAAIPENLLESSLFGTVKGSFTGATDSPGLFEQAGSGTLFLDEINSMGLNLQSKLLRVLQEKMVRRVGGKRELPVNCRIVATTNQDPLECIREGVLRRDLYYRLAVIIIYIPPLKERKEDIEPLVAHFLASYNRKYNTGVTSLSPELMAIFQRYDWPGNIRELQHLIESAINMIDGEQCIRLEHLPFYFYNQFSSAEPQYTLPLAGKPVTLAEILREAEEKTILDTLSRYNGNITRAAATLGLARQNLHYRIRKLNIDPAKLRG